MQWINDFNTILRDIIFCDEELKRLMMIPEGTNIIDFIDRYFIRAGHTSKLLSNESVRIVYGGMATGFASDNVTTNVMSFDIYVKNEHLHNSERDRLVMRTQLIGKRLIDLLTKNRYNGVYRFYTPMESDMSTNVIGYTRYNVSLRYMRVY